MMKLYCDPHLPANHQPGGRWGGNIIRTAETQSVHGPTVIDFAAKRRAIRLQQMEAAYAGRRTNIHATPPDAA